MAIVSANCDEQPGENVHLQLARFMFEKGVSFVDSSILLRAKGGDQYVVLHLLCQGIENILKSLLLYWDFDAYWPRLRKFGHNLPKLAEEATAVYKLNPVGKRVGFELYYLNRYYSGHQFRYASVLDFFIDPHEIPYIRAKVRLYSVITLVRKKGIFAK